jgi:hypothetical protein
VLLDELQGRRAGVLQGDGRRPDQGEESRASVHVDDERIHRRQHLVGLVHDEVGPLGDDLQVVVGHERGDLHDDVAGVVQPRHLEIHPHEHERPG